MRLAKHKRGEPKPKVRGEYWRSRMQKIARMLGCGVNDIEVEISKLLGRNGATWAGEYDRDD